MITASTFGRFFIVLAQLLLETACHSEGRLVARRIPHSFCASVGEILRSADVPNIYVKLSGFHYVSPGSWDYPYPDTQPVVRQLYESFGPDRLCWGSDYPVVRDQMTYRQALEAFRMHCKFVPPADQEKILGGNLQRLLASAG